MCHPAISAQGSLQDLEEAEKDALVVLRQESESE